MGICRMIPVPPVPQELLARRDSSAPRRLPRGRVHALQACGDASPITASYPWRGLPTALRELLRPGLGSVVEEVIAAVRAEVPAYDEPLEGEFGRLISQGATVAPEQFAGLLGVMRTCRISQRRSRRPRDASTRACAPRGLGPCLELARSACSVASTRGARNPGGPRRAAPGG
jgi:hypothetical protein